MSEPTHAELHNDIGGLKTDVAVLTRRFDDHATYEAKHQDHVVKSLAEVQDGVNSIQSQMDKQRGAITVLSAVFAGLWTLILLGAAKVMDWWG